MLLSNHTKKLKLPIRTTLITIDHINVDPQQQHDELLYQHANKDELLDHPPPI